MQEHQLSPIVNYIVLPLFAFANAGVRLTALSSEELMGIPLAIFIGLFFGKTLGIFSFTFIATKLKIVSYPAGMTHRNLLALSMIGGIGFTVSLFIATLAYTPLGEEGIKYLNQAKMGVFAGSIISGLIGYFFLKTTLCLDQKRGKGIADPAYIALHKQQ